MELRKSVGPAAASRKYDILSALMAFALSGDKATQKQVMRMMALITTRYNWQRDELSMGQQAIAKLWCVETRTVKRELAKFQAKGWLVLKQRGARGRVSVYGLNLEQMLEDTRHVWPHIGPDFIERLDPKAQPTTPTNVVAFRAVAAPKQDGSLWADTLALLHQEDTATYGAWFHGLAEVGHEHGTLCLAAPSKFHATYVETHLKTRLLAALRRIDPTLSNVTIEG